jgi:hypothetical protein
LHFLIGVHVVRSIARELCETSDILTHGHGSLLQILKFLLLELHYSLRNMMRAKDSLKLVPVDAVGFFMSFYVRIPPVSCRAYELVRGQLDLLPIVALYNLKFFLYDLEPVVSIHWLHAVWEAWWLSPLKISKFVSLLRLWCLLVLLHIDHCLLHVFGEFELASSILALVSMEVVSSIAVLTVVVVVGPDHLKNMV